ncbi:MAG: Uma2 family endonuclease [Isosphaeraceae bacterium]|nr:Uma2 family endonuclease [Isosphaeraceae bacterium]
MPPRAGCQANRHRGAGRRDGPRHRPHQRRLDHVPPRGRSLQRGSGKEPDESFYFAHEGRIHDKDQIDLTVDPPPDSWIEVDQRGSSRGRLPLYARRSVSEVWRYRVRRGDTLVRPPGGQHLREDRPEPEPVPMLTPEAAHRRCSSTRQAPAHAARSVVGGPRSRKRIKVWPRSCGRAAFSAVRGDATASRFPSPPERK